MYGDLIRNHLRDGQVRLALVAALDVAADVPPEYEAEIYGLLARIQLRVGQPREALRAARRAVEASTPASRAWEPGLALGEALLAMGEPFQSCDLLTSLLDAPLPMPTGGDPVGDAVVAVKERAERDLWVSAALAEANRATGRAAEGLAIANRALATADHVFGPSSAEAAEAWHVLGRCELSAGRPNAALTAFRRAYKLRTAVDSEHLELAALEDALGLAERALGRPERAVKHHRQAILRWQAVLGDECGPVGGSRHSLAQALHRCGEFEAARDEMAVAVAVTARSFGADHVDTHIARFELGRFRVDTGLVEEGFGEMTAARVAVTRQLGRDHPVVRSMDRWL
jgi:tetratricopeptide (TPR) repeat protein